MPGGDEIEGRIGGAQTADIDDSDEAFLVDQHVAGDEVAVGHDVASGGGGQSAEPGPQSPERLDIEQRAAPVETGRHPDVVIGQLTSATRATKGPTPGGDRADVSDELGQ